MGDIVKLDCRMWTGSIWFRMGSI